MQLLNAAGEEQGQHQFQFNTRNSAASAAAAAGTSVTAAHGTMFSNITSATTPRTTAVGATAAGESFHLFSDIEDEEDISESELN